MKDKWCKDFKVLVSRPSILTLDFKVEILKRAGHEPDADFRHRADSAHRGFMLELPVRQDVKVSQMMKIKQKSVEVMFIITGSRKSVAQYALEVRSIIKEGFKPLESDRSKSRFPDKIPVRVPVPDGSDKSQMDFEKRLAMIGNAAKTVSDRPTKFGSGLSAAIGGAVRSAATAIKGHFGPDWKPSFPPAKFAPKPKFVADQKPKIRIVPDGSIVPVKWVAAKQ